jgi:quercetin dioxygenase-like cupin family protein
MAAGSKVMGLYTVPCRQCDTMFLWFSGDLDQRCTTCKGKDVQKASDTVVPMPAYADKIKRLESNLRIVPQIEGMATFHQFADNGALYGRSIVIPPGVAIVSKTHARECFFVILTGRLRVRTDEGTLITLEAGGTFVAPPGKRAVFAIPEYGPVVAFSVHRLDPATTDLAEVERQLVVPDLDKSGESQDNYDFNNQLKDPALAYAPAPRLEKE